MSNAQHITDAIAKLTAEFGEVFGLKSEPRDRFKIVEGASFSRVDGTLMIYVYRHDDAGGWLAYSKGTIEECRRYFVKL